MAKGTGRTKDNGGKTVEGGSSAAGFLALLGRLLVTRDWKRERGREGAQSDSKHLGRKERDSTHHT